jgi:hypothetical protein
MMDQLALRELDAALRTRLDIFLMMAHHTINPGVPYLDNWHIDAMVAQAEAVMKGEVTRLIGNVPPCYLKSSHSMLRSPPLCLAMTRASESSASATAKDLRKIMPRNSAR